VVLSEPGAVEARLGALRPRDCDFVELEVPDVRVAEPALRRLGTVQKLLAAAGAGPVLLGAIQASDPAAGAVAKYLREAFPPDGPIPAVPAELLPAVREIALGEPGDPVRHGLFPSYPTKLARLALAARGEYDAAVVLAAAERAYEPGRPYHGHDALACALVHPGIGAGERAGLEERYAGHGRNQRGWRSRRKTHRVLIWSHRYR
jgi:hypothetical protein